MLLLPSCAGISADSQNPSDLSGEWKQSNSGSTDSYQAAFISKNKIEIYQVTEGQNTAPLYWSGRFIAPEDAKELYSWTSEFDGNEQVFVYENGKITYDNVELSRDSWGFTGICNDNQELVFQQETPVTTPNPAPEATPNPEPANNSEIPQAEIPVAPPAETAPTEGNTDTPTEPANNTGDNFNTYDNEAQQQTDANYVLNSNTRTFHNPSCNDVRKIAPENYLTSYGTRDEVIAIGYSPCGHCHP